MKKATGFCLISLMLVSAPGLAANWRYIVYQGSAVTYDGPNPPVDLSYPPLGQSAPVITLGDQPRGAVMSASQFAEDLSKPHVVIVPPSNATPPARSPTLGSKPDSGVIRGGNVGY